MTVSPFSGLNFREADGSGGTARSFQVILEACRPYWCRVPIACTSTATNRTNLPTSTSIVMRARRSSGWNLSHSLGTLDSRRQNCDASNGWSSKIVLCCWRNGMNASHPNAGERVRDVHVTEDTLAVDLADGRTIIVPLAWYPRLLSATSEQRSHWEIAGAGYGIHWPDLDEDLSTEGLLRGAPAASEPAHIRR
jgi:hypothetical protein